MLLARGAAKVYAVDVGRGQLDWKLRQDPRVVVLEKTNARDLSRAQVPEPVDLISCDASFIGLETVLPAPLALAAPGAVLIALIKPQFEVGKGQGLGTALAGSGIFPQLSIQMIQVGEQSGQLENMLTKIADVYENEVENSILRLTSYLEPVMILVMGSIVGFIVLSICLPIFEMNQLVR